MSDLFGVAGRDLLASVRLAPESRARVDSALRLIKAPDFEIDLVTKRVADRPQARLRLPGDPGPARCRPVLAAIFVAEIGDVTRFPPPRSSCPPWGGMTPRHRESDTTVHRDLLRG